jgi:3-dehydroquinate synthase
MAIERITIHPSAPTPVTELYFGRGLLRGELLRELCFGLKPIVIADKAVPTQLLLDAEVIRVDPCGIKTREAKERIENTLMERGYGRDAVIVALGGGSVTDAVGFVAATYLRGVTLILVPTTVLAMVDAAIGGKTAVDTAKAKNLIGAIYHPKAVVIDPDILAKTRDLDLAEMLKIALTSSAPLWAKIEKTKLSDEVMLDAIQAKIKVIEQDPLERGLRRVLNFGHTVAHALEVVSEYKMSHAEAVILGVFAESYLSHRLGFLSDLEWQRIERFYKPLRVKLPVTYSRDKLLQAMILDKKNQGREIRFVLIEGIGKVLSFDGQYCTPVPLEKIHEMCSWMEKTDG